MTMTDSRIRPATTITTEAPAATGDAPAAALTLSVCGEAPRAWIRLVGELDLATVAPLRSALCRLHETGHRDLEVQLAELSFLSAAGLDALCEADRYWRATAGSVVLTDPTPWVRRLLQVAGLDATLTVRPAR